MVTIRTKETPHPSDEAKGAIEPREELIELAAGGFVILRSCRIETIRGSFTALDPDSNALCLETDGAYPSVKIKAGKEGCAISAYPA